MYCVVLFFFILFPRFAWLGADDLAKRNVDLVELLAAYVDTPKTVATLDSENASRSHFVSPV